MKSRPVQTSQSIKRRVHVFGGSVATGWPDQIPFAQIYAQSRGYGFRAYGGAHRTIRETRASISEVRPEDLVVIQHGVSESIKRPNSEAQASMPSRFKRTGGLDPAPWKSSTRLRRTAQVARNRLKWLLRIYFILAGQTYQMIAPEEFQVEFRSFVEEICQIVTSGRVVIVGPVNLPNNFYPLANRHLKPFVQSMKSVASEFGVPYLEIKDVLTKMDLLADGVHPSLSGHRKISDLIADVLDRNYEPQNTTE